MASTANPMADHDNTSGTCRIFMHTRYLYLTSHFNITSIVNVRGQVATQPPTRHRREQVINHGSEKATGR